MTSGSLLARPLLAPQNREVIPWLAGLLEGDGTFVAGPPSDPNGCQVRLQLTDHDVATRVTRLLGVRCGMRVERRTRRLMFGGRLVSHTPAYELMLLLHPLLGERRQVRIGEILRGHTLRRRVEWKTISQVWCDVGRLPNRECLWLAGLFEAEGWCGFDQGRLRLSITSTDRDVAKAAARALQGRVTTSIPRERWHRAPHKARVYGAVAARNAMRLYQVLGSRRGQQCVAALAAYADRLASRRHHNRSLSKREVHSIRARLEEGANRIALADRFGVDPRTISNIATGRTYRSHDEESDRETMRRRIVEFLARAEVSP